MYQVQYANKTEFYPIRSWALKHANDLKNKNIHVIVSIDDYIIFEYIPLPSIPEDQEG